MPSRHDSVADSPAEFVRLTAVKGPPPIIFQIGDGHLVFRSSDHLLNDRYRRLYGDCQVNEAAAHGPRVECDVWADPPAGTLVFDVRDPDPVDLGQFMETAFADRGCRRLPPTRGEWQAMEAGDPRVSFRIRGQRVEFPSDAPWQGLAANLAFALTIRLQRDVIYLHAAGIAVGAQQRGVLFVGPKGTGKTTTALGLASRGHTLLGDEIVGVRQTTSELVSVLRAISKRDGPCAQAVDQKLATLATERTQYPDGERTVVAASRLFTSRLATAHLHAIVFLSGFRATPALTSVPTSLDTASKVIPVTSTFWGRSQASRVFALVKMVTAVPCFALQLGPPDLTSRLLEDTFAQ